MKLSRKQIGLGVLVAVAAVAVPVATVVSCGSKKIKDDSQASKTSQSKKVDPWKDGEFTRNDLGTTVEYIVSDEMVQNLKHYVGLLHSYEGMLEAQIWSNKHPKLTEFTDLILLKDFKKGKDEIIIKRNGKTFTLKKGIDNIEKVLMYKKAFPEIPDADPKNTGKGQGRFKREVNKNEIKYTVSIGVVYNLVFIDGVDTTDSDQVDQAKRFNTAHPNIDGFRKALELSEFSSTIDTITFAFEGKEYKFTKTMTEKEKHALLAKIFPKASKNTKIAAVKASKKTTTKATPAPAIY